MVTNDTVILEKLAALEKRTTRLEAEVAEMRKDGERTPDQVFGEAVSAIKNVASFGVSYLQRRLAIGYARAARIADQLEEQGYAKKITSTRLYQVKK
jgi:DNA segregation ATPase FtsK/SpoIIIE-like protein